MPKYSDESLRAMAKELIEARDNGDFRYVEFVMAVSIKARVSTTYVESMIANYAK